MIRLEHTFPEFIIPVCIPDMTWMKFLNLLKIIIYL